MDISRLLRSILARWIASYRADVSVGSPGLECPLILKQPVVHLPVLALFLCAMGGFGCLEGKLMNSLKREVESDVPELSGFNVLFLDLWIRHTDVPGTIRSLIVRELDQRELRVALAFDWIIT